MKKFCNKQYGISIHVLREEDDDKWTEAVEDRTYFNPRPPRGGRLYIAGAIDVDPHFNPRPPRGGRL